MLGPNKVYNGRCANGKLVHFSTVSTVSTVQGILSSDPLYHIPITVKVCPSS